MRDRQGLAGADLNPARREFTRLALFTALAWITRSRPIDVDRLIAAVTWPEQRLGAGADVPWPRVEGFPADLRFGHKLFVYRQGAVTPPHVHNHLVSAHWVLRGAIWVRTFDRVRDLEASILLRPTRDEVARPGALVTMSDDLDNGHWFEGVSPSPQADGTIDAPILTFQDSVRKFGS